MTTLLRTLTLFTMLLCAGSARAQGIYDGLAVDSAILRFNGSSVPGLHPDGATVPLWQVGNTHKASFTSAAMGVTAMMTDTDDPYPVNANNFFTIRLKNSLNMIVSFWHRYQTRAGYDGGIVEFSTDHGATWNNAKGDCNSDPGMAPGIITSNFHAATDTVYTGEPAFTGSSAATVYSRMQFFTAIPLRTTAGPCSFMVDSIYIRFRFVSDAAADTLDGWMIDSIKVERDLYTGDVAGSAMQPQLPVVPNPSANGVFIMPALADEEDYTVTLYNVTGQRVYNAPYGRRLDISGLPKGMYLYKVSGKVQYNGRLMYE